MSLLDIINMINDKLHVFFLQLLNQAAQNNENFLIYDFNEYLEALCCSYMVVQTMKDKISKFLLIKINKRYKMTFSLTTFQKCTFENKNKQIIVNIT